MQTRLSPFPQSFYNRSALEVAPDLIGALLIHHDPQSPPNTPPLIGVITETEAYCGQEDQACHARVGRTQRTAPMFGPPGHAYVYFTYGMHWLFNCVTQPIGEPHAVLIRAVEPLNHHPLIQSRRGKQPRKQWTNGPAKLTQAFNIQVDYNNLDLTTSHTPLYLAPCIQTNPAQLLTSPRIGLFTVPEPWKSLPWRFNAPHPAQLAQQATDSLTPILNLH